jgi:hypothetical protein
MTQQTARAVLTVADIPTDVPLSYRATDGGTAGQGWVPRTRDPNGSRVPDGYARRCPQLREWVFELAAVTRVGHRWPPRWRAGLAIRHAILTGALDARIGLQHIPSGQRDMWAARLDAAENAQPSDFTNNGWVVEALQAAWSAITTTPIPTDHPAEGVCRADHLRLALDAAVRGGNDTDTVAAIAGGLLGAAYGASAVPAE